MHWLDPSALPIVRGRVAQFTLNRHGDVDGVLLDGDRQVHVPPHMGPALEKLVAVGESIEARYVKPRGADVFAAVTVTSAAGKTIVDGGPPPKHERHDHRNQPARRPVHVGGRVRLTLYAPKGEVCGGVLGSGEQLRVDPKANAELADYFTAGAEVQVWGEAIRRKGVVTIDVHEIAFEADMAES